MSRVFIGIPTFNRPRFIRETLASLLSQTMTDWRAVVSDNASAPEAAEEVRSYVESLEDSRIAYVLQPTNGGEYGQGRFFLGALRDENYFVILHDDDLLQPDYFATAAAALDDRCDLAYYAANPTVIDENGTDRPELTRWYYDYHGRTGANEGSFSVLDSTMQIGFTPICGTFFRSAVVRETGLVDPDLGGNYPFELNVFLRIGERGHRAWFNPKNQLVFRIHGGALRASDRLMQNPQVVSTMMTLLERRQFEDENERRRRTILARLHRAKALIALRGGDYRTARKAILTALRHNWRSKNTLVLAPAMVFAPSLVRRFLPAPSNIACPPNTNLSPLPQSPTVTSQAA